MAISYFREKPFSQENTGNPPSITYHFTAYPDSDGLAVQAAAYMLTPATVVGPYGLMYRQTINVDPEGHDQWHVTVPYAQQKREAGSFQLSFDTLGGTVNRKLSIATVDSYKAAEIETAIPDYKGAIDVQDDGSVKGCETIIPALKLTATFKHPTGFINGEQIKALARATGSKNSDDFLGYEAGEVLFLGATGTEGTDIETSVSYHFACSENITEQTIGPFDEVTKEGWDYAWCVYADFTSEAQAVRQPKYLYIEQVYPGKDLASILGFG